MSKRQRKNFPSTKTGRHNAKRNNKDTVFRMLFNEPERLLQLYNAINSTHYTNSDELTITTLENAIYMTMKNDVSCIVDMRLSDSFTHKDEEPQLELIVTQININPGYNDELLDACPVLGDYSQYVSKVRKYQKDMSLTDAVDKAVDECISEGIQVDFFKKNKARVKNMSIYEYDEELHIKTMMEIGREEGKLEGMRGTVVALRSMGCDDETIVKKLIDVYDISNEVAKELLRG